MKFSKPIPYHPDTRTLGPVSMKIWFYLADNKRVKLNHASASLTPGSGWEGLVDLKTRYILDNTTFQIDASLKRPLRLSEYQGLILTKRSIPIQSTLTPEGSVPGMGIPVPIGGAPVIDQIDLTIPDIPHPELITDVYYAGNDESGHPVAVVQATVNLPFTFTEEEIAGITECISISVTDGRTAITEGPEIIEGQYKKRFITGNAPPDVMQKSGVIVTVRSSVAGLLLAEEVSLTFAPSLSYILNIKPSRSLFVTVKDPAHLHAEVFSQDESGTLRQVPDSELHLDLPSGISEFLSVSPITARGVLNAAITQTRPTNLQEIEFSLNASVHEDAVPPQTITVHFNAPASRSIETRFESDKNAISPFLIPDRAILLVRFSTDAPEAPIWTFERAQPDGWLDEPSTPVDYGDGWTAVALKATPPDPEYTGDPPASEDIIITATSGNTRSGPVSVPVLLLKRPTIEADTYQVTLVKGIKETVRVQVRIDHGGSESWVFAIDPEKTLKRVNATITGLDDTHAEIAMTEQDSPDERSESLYDSETVIVTASPRSGELSFPLECHIAVIISKEGLFIDTIARRKDTGMYHVPVPNSQMDSSALLDFYYLVLTEDNQIISHTSAITDPSPLDFTTMEDEKTKPYNAAKGSGLTFVSSGVRQLNTPSAVYSVSMIRPIPFDGTPIPVRCRATVQNHAGSEETGYCDFILALETDNVNPGSASWEIEVRRCERIINTMAPEQARPELHTLLSKRKQVLGVEGLVQLRWMIYNQEFYRERHGEYPYKTDASGRVITGPDGKPVIDQAKCNEYAEHMDQTVTDRFHTDAYGGGKEDIGPATRGDMKGKPYKDLEATTRTMETKVYEWYDRAERAMKSGDPKAAGAYKEEGMRQLTKQFKNQIEPVVNKYNELAGYPDPPIARIPENVRAGVEIMNRVGKDGFTPADAEAALAHMGESPRSIIQKMSGILESGQKHMSAGQRQQLHEYLKTLPDE